MNYESIFAKYGKSRCEKPHNIIDSEPPKLSSRELFGNVYASIILEQFDEFCSSSAEQDGADRRCPYCNCKIDSTKTHCASCGAPY